MLIAGGAYYIGEQVRTLDPAQRKARYSWLYYSLIIGGLFAASLSMPVVPVNSFWWKLADNIHQLYREEIGWPEMVKTVADIRDTVPLEERSWQATMAKPARSTSTAPHTIYRTPSVGSIPSGYGGMGTLRPRPSSSWAWRHPMRTRSSKPAPLPAVLRTRMAFKTRRPSTTPKYCSAATCASAGSSSGRISIILDERLKSGCPGQTQCVFNCISL